MTVLNTGVSGLMAYQRALATTSHNIANATTDGYSRQRVELAAQTPHKSGSSYLGQGVYISSVKRIQSDLIDAQLRSATSDNTYAETLVSHTERADSLLSGETTGLSSVLQSFFSSLEDVASDPTSVPARTVALGDAESLSKQFASINTQLEDQRTMVNGQITGDVDDINEYAQSLAGLNRQIIALGSSGASPNDLLDQRDDVLSKLSEKIDVTTKLQDDGSLSVFIGNGQTLVMGTTAAELVATSLSGDHKNLDIGLKNASGGQIQNINRYVSGGELGALLETRTDVLDRAQNQLGLIALNLATQMNGQNKLGLDLNGELGQDIFTLPEVQVSSRTGNAATSQPSVVIADVTQLTSSDYRLKYDGSAYQLTRLPDNESVTLVPDATNPGTLVADGLRIETKGLTDTQAGDTWLIQPTRYAASGIGLAISEPEQIAAATAVTATSSDLNTGAASIQEVRALDASDPSLLTRAVVTYDGASYSVNGNPPTSVQTKDGVTTIVANGWQLELAGTPAAGDQFVVTSNAGNQGDNGNLQLMIGLQDGHFVEGKTTYADSYTNLVGDIATQTSQAQTQSKATATLLESAQGQRETLSGVNLDEEAADLIRYQQAYRAASQVISASGTMFDTLLSVLQG